MLKIKLYGLFIVSLVFIGSCSPKLVHAPIPTTPPEVTYLDTMLITAEKPGELKANEYKLKPYRAAATRYIDLLHTELDIQFDWDNEKVLGKANLTLKPYYNPINHVTLDAKGFKFNKVTLDNNQNLMYEYDGKKITIQLGKKYTRNETIKLHFDYIASPSESGGSAAITSDKGLFFINPRNEVPNKPQQIWTQGETENNSRWFPTIDKPNERCTQELRVTVQDKFKTLSNGLLTNSQQLPNGMRQDTWKMDQPHAPYLFALIVGDFAVVEDAWKDIDVDYYVEQKYKAYAKNIFPHTPEMLSFFSEILDFKYPWPKYSQVVVRDFVSGAMENTTSVIFGDFMQGTDRELIDVATNEKIVAHEMMHHWFGDYVTCENWANLTLNEGFANYSEYLWLEHKHGKKAADAHWLEEFEAYLNQVRTSGLHPLVHFHYNDKEDMFDAHSYNKGGMVLHMLRNELGDQAFFEGLNKYLNDNAFTAVEVDELRLAFEALTGQDLNWFFDQWFLGQGHPLLDISKNYNDSTKEIEITITQKQTPPNSPAIFVLPIEIDIYLNKKEKRKYKVLLNERKQSFSFSAYSNPIFVDIDPNKVLLSEITYPKSEEELIFQYENTSSFLNELESLRQLGESTNPNARAIYQSAITDEYWINRMFGVTRIHEHPDNLAMFKKIAQKDPHSQVRIRAIEKLGTYNDSSISSLLKDIISSDQSFRVQGSALMTLKSIDKEAATNIASKLENSSNDNIINAIAQLYSESNDLSKIVFFEKNSKTIDGQSAISFFQSYATHIIKSDKNRIKSTVNYFYTIGYNPKNSLFRRFASVLALNDLYVAFISDSDLTISSDIEAKINEIKAKETDSQLQQLYSSFPTQP